MNAFIDFLLRVSPLIALGIAWAGVDTWKRQIKGTDKYKVAADLLLALYKLREGVKVVRSPLVEFSPKIEKGDTEELAYFKGYAEVMDRKWQRAAEPMAEVSLLALKAEVHLGKAVKDAVEDVTKKVRLLQIVLEAYLDFKYPGSDYEFDTEDRKVLWAKPTNDKFNDEFEQAISNVEGLLRPHL